MTIHPTAVVDASAQIAEGVVIGPWCIVGPGVTLAEGVRLGVPWLVNPLLGAVAISGQPQRLAGREHVIEAKLRQVARRVSELLR